MVSTHKNKAACLLLERLSKPRAECQLPFAVTNSVLIAAMSAYPELFEVVGPCELWPDEILDAFVRDVCSESMKTMARFCYERAVSVELLTRVLGELPCGPASQQYIEYVQGLYAMWSCESQEDSSTLPPCVSVPSGSVVRHHEDLGWCLPLEKYAGPIGNWPDDVLQALRSDQNNDSGQKIAEWGYFYSIPLDDLTDILNSQRGATGEISYTAFLSKVYSDMFYTEAGLSNVLESALSAETTPLGTPEVPNISLDDDVVIIENNAGKEERPPSPKSPPLITIVDLGDGDSGEGSKSQQEDATPSWLLSGPDLSRPEILGRLGDGYVRSTLAREDRDPFDAAWKAILRRLGAPRAWPLDIRQCFAGRVDEQNALVVASFSYMNGVLISELLEYLHGRPHGLPNSTVVKKLVLYYDMWNNPKRGHYYRKQRFAYNIKLQRYLDLNLCESSNPTVIAKNKLLFS